MNREDINAILENITMSFQGKPLLIFSGSHGTQIWVQVGSERPDCNNPNLIEIGKGGKAYISEHATDDEIVKKVLGLCLAYVEHEMREGFYYKGVRCFGPHISLEAMIEAAQYTNGRTK